MALRNRSIRRKSLLDAVAVLLCGAVSLAVAGRVGAIPPDSRALTKTDGQNAKKATEKPSSQRPQWDPIEAAVRRHFAARPDYRPGEIISRNQVDSLLLKLKRLGWSVPRLASLTASVLADSDPLVVQLRTEQGRKFMARLSGSQAAYDRLDRLSNLVDGRRIVSDLIKGPGGEQLIDYMTRSPGGRVLSKQLSGAPTGANFDKPTGRLYTVDALVVQLRTLYTAETGGAAARGR